MSAGLCAWAQTPAPPPDVLVLVDNEKLIGHLESADSDNLIFKSDIAGEVKIPWAKVKELQSPSKFAVAQKGQTFKRGENPVNVPQGTLSVAEQQVTVTPASGAPQTIPVANTQNVIPDADFVAAFKSSSLLHGWTGAAAAGFDLVQATQKSRTVTSSIDLVRTVPGESWIATRYRTTFGFNSAYGDNTSGGVSVKTNIIHAALEQDEYLNQKLFVFEDAAFDHNFSQGLQLQTTVGGGLGYVAYKDTHQELDFKAQIAYIDQNFSVGPSKDLIGAVVGEVYNRNFERGIHFHQEVSVTPSFNKPSAYSANFVANLGLPISKSFDITFGVLDGFLNNPPAGFQKNSFQFTTALSYKIQ